MSGKQVFVGRKEELKQFKTILQDPQGQAILVVGQQGMGKTFLVNKMAEIAASHPDLKCGCVRYEVTPTDSVDSTMALMMDNAFEAAQITEGSFAGTERRLEQWRAFLNVFNIGDLVLSLRRDPAKNTREQFLERLNLISKRMPEKGRAIFIIDPEKYMQEKSDQSWAIVVKNLPEKIKFVFAQRSEDMLVDSETFNSLNNVVCIPEERLDVLDESSVDELIGLESAKIKYPINEVKNVISNYKGHPYAVGAALELLKAGVKLEELPKRREPKKFAEIQLKEICKKSEEAIKLFTAYAILEVGVPNEITEYVSRLNSGQLQHLFADNYLKGLLREEGEGKRIYHSILTDYILGQMNDEEKKKYHLRTVKIYRGKLKKAEKEQIKPDELAATRLPEHILAAEGEDSFVDVFINECYRPLLTIGALDSCISLSERALTMVKEGSEEQVALLGNLGIVYQIRGELDKAEEMHKKALTIDEKFGRLEGMTNQYGNLGLIYQSRDELDKAEEMFNKVLDIEKRLGRSDSIANSYGNLGLIYQRRGELDKAEEIVKKSLQINKKLGRLEEMAKDYGNLGTIYKMRGDLDKAEEMHNKALKINERLGSLEGVARDYSNLGLIYQIRGDLKKAKEYWVKARDLYKKIGMPNDVKEVQGWIDSAETAD